MFVAEPTGNQLKRAKSTVVVVVVVVVIIFTRVFLYYHWWQAQPRWQRGSERDISTDHIL